MVSGRLYIQSKRENINFRIKRSSIFLENKMFESRLLTSLMIAT